jgi:hypothetical protein
MPLHTTLSQSLRIPTTEKYENITRGLIDTLKSIEGISLTEYKNDHSSSSFRIEAKENTWSRSARRKRKRRKLQIEEAENDRQNLSLKLVCDVRIILPRHLERTGDTSLDLPTGGTSLVNAEWTGLEVGEEIEGNENCEHIMSREDVNYSLECQWVLGTDHGVFESFAGHIGRKVIECLHTAGTK